MSSRFCFTIEVSLVYQKYSILVHYFINVHVAAMEVWAVSYQNAGLDVRQSMFVTI